MGPRRAILASVVAIVLILPFSVVALASPPATSNAAPAPETALITATGTGTIPGRGGVDFAVSAQTLFIGAQSKASSADVDTAVGEMEQRLLAIEAALEKAGVPATGIRFQGLNVFPQSAPPQPGQPSPVDKGQPLPQQVTSFQVTGALQADVPDLKLLVAALNAATANGATQVSVGGKGGPMPTSVQPPADALATGVSEALANARATAQAVASASGKKLGDVHSVSVNQIFPSCCPPQPANGWTVQLTVSFATAAP